MSWQRLLSALTVVCVVALLGPAAAWANGPSAGDQQYIDPLSGSHHHSHSSTSSGSSSTTPPTSPSPSPTTTSVTPTATTPTTTATSASSTPATTTTTSSSTHDPSGKTLPFTGFDVDLGAALGLCLMAGGVYLRRVSSRA